MAIRYQRNLWHQLLLLCMSGKKHMFSPDVVWHIKGKGHQGKQQALQSSATLDGFSVSTPFVGIKKLR